MTLNTEINNKKNAVNVDEVKVCIGEDDTRIIRTDSDFTEFWEKQQSKQETIDCHITNCYGWSKVFAWKVFSLLRALECPKRYHRGQERLPGKDLFAILLTFEPESGELNDLAMFQDFLVLGAAALYPSMADQAADKIAKRLREVGFNKATFRSIARKIRVVIQEFSASTPASAATLAKQIFADISCDEKVALPRRYSVSIDGITNDRGEQIAAAPALLCGRSRDIKLNDEKVELMWRRDGTWRKTIVARVLIADRRSIIALADRGFPVDSNNASEMVRYLTACDSENTESIGFTLVTTQLGYHKVEEEYVFVLPSQTLSKSGTTKLKFASNDEGMVQLAAGYRQKGRFEAWRQCIQEAAEHPKVMLAIAASLAPTLYVFLDVSNLIIDFSGQTSGGKTITLRGAASVWGNPDEGSESCVVKTWAATKTFLERTAGFANNLPTMIDDSMNASDPSFINDAIYMLAQGQGKGRANVVGLQPSETFRTIVMSTGEQPLTSATRAGGTRSRTVTLWGSPWGEFSTEAAAAASAFNTTVCENYGLAGPKFVKFVLDSVDDWDHWQKAFEETKAAYIERATASENHFAARMAPTLAAIELAFRLAHDCFKLEFEYYDPVENLWDEIAAEAAQADQSREALRHVYDVVSANRNRFHPQSAQSLSAASDCWGRWDSGPTLPPSLDDDLPQPAPDSLQAETWEFIGIMPHRLEKILGEAGFEAKAIRRAWFDQDWLKVNSGKSTLKTRIKQNGACDSSPVEVVAIKRAALIEVLEG